MRQSNLTYNSFFGQLVRTKTSGRWKQGTIAGTVRSDGYREVEQQGSKTLAHRLIWELHNGPIPEGMEIDHKNGRRDCNYIWNLRLATCTQNNRNARIRKDNRSGVKGVGWHKASGKWIARLQRKEKPVCRYFDSLDEAEQWLISERLKQDGEFTNNGFN